MLILSRSDVIELLPMSVCVALMEKALASLSRGEVILPLRPVIRIPDSPNAFAVMPTWSSALNASGAKLITVYPGNHGTALDSHQGVVTLFDGKDGRLLALMDATSITGIRTAAVSGVATNLLAREDAAVVAILGAGTQGRTHVDAMLAVRQFREIMIWSRTRSHAEALVRNARDRHASLDVKFIAVSDAETAVRRADVVCTTTAAREPILRGEWLRPGTHLNVVGASLPNARELDTDAIRRSRVYVDRRESALNEAGDLLIPMKEGAVGPDHIVAEIGEILIGKAAGRRDENDITLFKSLGLAVEDLACAKYLHESATRAGRGTEVEI